MLPEKTASYTLLDDSARTTSWYTSVWKPTVLIAFAILICVSIVVVLYVDENNQNDGYQWVKMRMSEFQSMFPKNDSAVDLITNQTTPSSALPTTLYVAPTSLLGCELKRMDPWDPEIEYYIDPNYKPNCKANRTQISQFVGGKILINSTEHTCQGRCLLPKNDWEHVKGNWEPVTTFNAKCDIVEVECNKTATNTIDYNYLHSQIYEREDDTNYGSHKVNQTKIPGRKVTSHFERPNIYLILFDSTSTTQFIRSMAKTFYYLKERHEATIIEHLNKVGINSRPNAWALMFSKQVYELGKNPYVDEMLPELNHTMNCVNANDDQDWWGHRLRDLGYHTMIGEDWASGALNWPNCWGFKRPAAKHYMKPFQRRNEEQGGEIIRKTITEMCHETYQDLFPYLDQFMSAYKNQSEFAWIWNSELAHNYVNGLYHADETLYRLLIKHEDRLNNSFVFMQGDHGMRFGGIRSTAHGEMEDNNPLLMISVPVKYRNTNLPKVLKENAKKLITHYDSYASLMHLVELITNNTLDEELSNPKPQEFQRGHGSSYFRARMNEPRDCGTLRIPYEYCLCDKKFEDPLKTDLQLTKDLGQYAIEYFQSEIDVENVTSRCQPATVLHEKTVAEKLVLSDAREIYRMKFTATPEERIFSGFVEVHRKNGTVERIEKMSKRFDRLNSYGDQGECVKAFEELRPVCYCKNYKKQ